MIKIKISRDELKQQAELLKLLEHYEKLQKATDFYTDGSLTLNMGGNAGTATQKWYIYSNRGKATTLEQRLAEIAAIHYNNMIEKQIELIKSQLELELT